MKKQDCYELGYVTRTHGLNGEVQVFLDVDDPEIYLDLESVFLEIKGQLVPYFVEDMALHKSGAIMKFEEVDTVEAAEKLKGLPIFLPLSELPELEEGQFYFHDIIGFTVVDAEKGALGTVREVLTSSVQDLLLMDYQGAEVLIPIVDSIVVGVDHEAKQVNTQLPEGLLELYLEDSAQAPDDGDEDEE